MLRRSNLKRFLGSLGIMVLVAILGYLAIRPWHLRWGATDAEVRMSLPGDELVPDADDQRTRAITIHASAAEIYPWLVQLGWERGGLYSYEGLENLAGLEFTNADRIHLSEKLSEFQVIPDRTRPLDFEVYSVEKVVTVEVGKGVYGFAFGDKVLFVGHGTVIAGRPIIDAHHYESRLQWIGIMLTPSVLEHRQDLTAAERRSFGLTLQLPEGTEQAALALTQLTIQPCSSVPLQDVDGQVTAFDGFAIVPIGLNERPSLKALRDSLDKASRKLERLKQLAPEARSQAKYQRSLVWLEEVRRNFVDQFSERIK